MPRGPAKICALLLVLWIVAVVILPTIDLPNTTLPARAGIPLGGLLILGVLGLGLLPHVGAGTPFLSPGGEKFPGCGTRDVINLTCSRLC